MDSSCGSLSVKTLPQSPGNLPLTPGHSQPSSVENTKFRVGQPACTEPVSICGWLQWL